MTQVKRTRRNTWIVCEEDGFIHAEFQQKWEAAEEKEWLDTWNKEWEDSDTSCGFIRTKEKK